MHAFVILFVYLCIYFVIFCVLALVDGFVNHSSGKCLIEKEIVCLGMSVLH